MTYLVWSYLGLTDSIYLSKGRIVTREHILKTIEAVVKNLPEEWVALTTHRLDIYDESQAKKQFLTEFEKIDLESINPETLGQLPTAYDYVRLGHQLSSILEWAIAGLRNVPPAQVVSFSSKTMPLLSVLRENQIRGKKTEIYYEIATSPLQELELLEDIYGYHGSFIKVSSIDEVPDTGEATRIFVTDQMPSQSLSESDQVQMSLHLHKHFGSVMVIEDPQGGEGEREWDAVIQHTRRRESIAITPPNTVPLLKELLGGSSEVPQEANESDWQNIFSAVEAKYGKFGKALCGFQRTIDSICDSYGVDPSSNPALSQ